MVLFGLLSVKAQLLNQSFDGATFPPAGWVNVHSGGPDAIAIWTRAVANTIGGDGEAGDLIVSPHSGAGMAEFASWDFAAGNGAYLASPVVNLSASGPQKVSFWMYRDPVYTNRDSVSVYINTAQNITGATFIGRVQRQSTQAPPETAEGWYQYSFAIPASFNTATNYILLKAGSGFGNNMYIDDVLVENNTACTGTPVGGTAAASEDVICGAGTPINVFVAGASSTSGITYQWESSPTGTGSFAVITGATAPVYNTTPTQSTDYRVKVSCGAAFSYSSIVSVFYSDATVNDEACGAIVLTSDGAAHCGNTTCATDNPDELGTCSTPNNTVWYKFTPTADGAYVVKLKKSAGASDPLNAWVDVFTSLGTCDPLDLEGFYTCDLGADNNVDLTTVDSGIVSLTDLVEGTDYYIRLDGFSDAIGSYCISVEEAPNPPGCTTIISPANLATNVTGPITLTWNAVPGATSYEVFLDTENPPITSAGIISDTSGIILGTPNTTFYWYVVPANAGGSATGCDDGITSFTTGGGPANDGCATAANLPVSNGFCERPVLGTLVFADTTEDLTAPECSPNASSNDVWYSVSVPASGNVIIQTSAVDELIDDLVLEAYAGTCGSLSLIDCNDDGNPDDFGPSALHARLSLSGRTPNETIYIRVMGYEVTQSQQGPFAICAFDSSVVPLVARGTACVNSTSVNIDSAFKYTWATLRTASGDIIAQVYPNGSILGNTTASAGIWPGVRVDGNGTYYLDRNVTVTPTTQPTAQLLTRLYYTDGELAALAAAAGGATTADLNCTKTNQTCAASQTVGAGGEFLEQADFGDYGADHFVDVIHDSYSTFYLHKGGIALPIILTSFNVTNDGKNNLLKWSTSQEINSLEFVVERSADSRNFTEIGRKAAAGNSSVERTYSFVHQQPAMGINYYRIKMVDRNGDYKYSAVKAIRNLGVNEISITPNPVKNSLKLGIYADKADAARVVITDMSGKAVYANTHSVYAGDNNIPVNTAALTAGSYIIKVQLNGDVQVRKFIKQ